MPPNAYGHIGQAIDYRIRYHFKVTDWRDMAATYGVAHLVADADLDGPIRKPSVLPSHRQLPRKLVEGFFALLTKAVSEIEPNRRIPTPKQERELARYCLALASFETVYRIGIIAWPPKHLEGKQIKSPQDFLSTIPDELVSDLAELGGTFARSNPQWHGRDDAILNPSFKGGAIVGPADGDLIVDRCLYDIKTTIQKQVAGYILHQIVGYALLDFEDEYQIERVGFVFPRQGTKVEWGLANLISQLTGVESIDVDAARNDFHDWLNLAEREFTP